MIVIGSTAIRHFYPDFPREPKDLDFVVKDKSKESKIKGVEFLENPVLLDAVKTDILDPDNMLTLKMSHLFWDINFDKHLFDVQYLLNKGHKYDIELLRKFRGYWETVHPKVKRSNLEQSKDNFFSNNVNKDTDEHDYLHTLINPVPMYTRILKDGAEVELDENKWDALSFEDKCEVVREESYIMAYERYKKSVPHKIAYNKQLKDNIRKHFPEYIALFAIENYPLLEKPKVNYRKIINQKLKENDNRTN